MAQSTKFIDVTRTYIPVDPNSFPVTLHGATREDAPEQKIPVMAYKGYNFLPTSYGYKSYFGTAKKIGIDALTANVDHVFIFQNQGFENILIALTDTGVWTKKGEVAGAWVNTVPMLTDVSNTVHYQWTYVIIANILYAYRQGQPSYQKFVHDSVTQLVITSVVPTFLNMLAQIGVFRAAGRLAFWDTTDSIAWSNLDNFADFVPSLETLAGTVRIADIQGRIVTIKPHGPGFIIYSTKSIIFVAQNTENLFQWKPSVILSTAGVAYPREVAVASPDTVHFAYTPEGLKKIDSAKEETIVPEVTDFLKDYDKPVYLRVLEGRYLFLEILDANYITGLVQISDEVVPSVTYSFPGNSYTINIAGTPAVPGIPATQFAPAIPPVAAIPAVLPATTAGGTCSILPAINAGGFKDMQPAAPANQSATNKSMRPVWTCYLSRNGVVDNSNIVWNAGLCPTIDPNGLEVNMSPGSSSLNKMTQTAANKVATTGAQAYVDGIWTMERFFQTQMAIWEMEDKNLKAYIAAITGRAKNVTRSTNNAACVEVPFARSECSLGKMVTDYSAPKFGYSVCSFWLTRMAVAAIDLIRVKANSAVCKDSQINTVLAGYSPDVWLGDGNVGYTLYATALAALNASGGDGTEAPPVNGYGTDLFGLTGADGRNIRAKQAAVSPLAGGGKTIAWAIWKAPAANWEVTINAAPPYVPVAQHVSTTYPSGGRYEKIETMSAHNKGVDVADFGVGGIETAYCEITGWSYTTNTGATAIAAAGACNNVSVFPKAGSGIMPGGAAPPVAGKDGSVCGQPYAPAVLPGLISVIGGGTGPGDGGAGGPIGGANGITQGAGGAAGGITVNWPTTNVVFPVGSFLLRLGSPAPMYPTFEGALIYDLQLKKWGKMQHRYKQLLDYSPVNSTMNGVVPSNVFGIMAGALGADGKISLFDAYPTDSYISYGKVGYYRGGNTSTEEVHVHFKSLSTGSLTVETSLEGRDLSAGFTKTELFVNATSASLFGAYPGRWCNIEIRGLYDINYLEYRGFTQGRR